MVLDVYCIGVSVVWLGALIGEYKLKDKNAKNNYAQKHNKSPACFIIKSFMSCLRNKKIPCAFQNLTLLAPVIREGRKMFQLSNPHSYAALLLLPARTAAKLA